MEQRAGTWALLVQRPRSAAPTHKNKTYPVFLTTPCATAHAPRTRGPWYSTTSKVLNPKPTPRKRMRVRDSFARSRFVYLKPRALSLFSLSPRAARALSSAACGVRREERCVHTRGTRARRASAASRRNFCARLFVICCSPPAPRPRALVRREKATGVPRSPSRVPRGRAGPRLAPAGGKQSGAPNAGVCLTSA